MQSLSIDDVGVSRDTVFQEIRSGGGSETGDFVDRKLGRIPWNDSFHFHFHRIRVRRGIVVSFVDFAFMLECCST